MTDGSARLEKCKRTEKVVFILCDDTGTLAAVSSVSSFFSSIFSVPIAITDGVPVRVIIGYGAYPENTRTRRLPCF